MPYRKLTKVTDDWQIHSWKNNQNYNQSIVDDELTTDTITYKDKDERKIIINELTNGTKQIKKKY